ncbi:glycosyltransferase [Salinibacter ruber]|uniref:glycosyltransferase n=1 Tax=Salinibacter ruber TaxID=146919 RepID=UPI00216849D0|nr:glycosyltransferase [Salinibacter ruber]MCS4136377.1 glycosyltransferase involved in cell wall biosynthesis [Salinibacter ruber]
MHRVRHSLPYFRQFGWKPVVLAVKPEHVEGEREERLQDTFPDDVDVRRTEALPIEWTRTLRVGDLALRALPYVLRRADKIIRQENIDLIYFSTTAFPILALGRYWKARFGVPYVVDMQDPWYSGTYDPDEAPSIFSKAWLTRQVGRVLEPITMSAVDGIISVSEGYCEILQSRYERVDPSMCEVIPFGAAQKDFDVLQGANVENTIFDPDDDKTHVVQVGRAGPDMDRAAHCLFDALATGRRKCPRLYDDLRLHFVGTRYSPQSPETMAPIAEEYGVGDLVHEQVTRVPYFQALRLLRDADMLLLLGSTDPNYTASKLYPYILAQRPLLTIFHENSSVVDITRETQAGTVVTYDNDEDTAGVAADVESAWTPMLERLPYVPDTDWNAFAPYTAEAMTQRQVQVFDRILQ